MLRFLIFLFAVIVLFSCQPEVHFASILDSYPTEMRSQTEPSKEKELSTEKEPPKRKEYTVTLPAKKKRLLDILIVLDTSGSMEHHLEKLGGRVLSLLDSISDYNWQMGFTTADHGDHEITKKENRDKISSFAEAQWKEHVNDPKSSFGKLMMLEAEPIQLTEQSWEFNILNQKILTHETPLYKEVFFNTVSHFPNKQCGNPPFCQKPMEQPLRSLKSAMERINLDNAELFRPGADFVSLIISNEEERQEDPGRAASAQEVADTFNKILKPLGKRFFAFNILVLDKECQESEKRRGGPKAATASIGVEIGKLAHLTGGENISICADDYGPSLEEISKAIEVFVEQSVDIEESFVPETLKVEFLNGEPIPWELSGNRLIFKREPEKDREIRISYFPEKLD